MPNPKPLKKPNKAKQLSTQKSFYSSIEKSEFPYISPDEFSARYSRSPEKDSTSTNYMRLARITKHQLIMERINKKRRKLFKTVKKKKRNRE